jgi:hypothetical protein
MKAHTVSIHARKTLDAYYQRHVLPKVEAAKREALEREQAIAEAAAKKKAAERKNWTSIDYLNARLALISSTPLRKPRN